MRNEIFVRMLTVHCDQNDSYEITINGYPVEADIGMFAKLSTSNLPDPILKTNTSHQIYFGF